MDEPKRILGIDYNNLLIGSFFGGELINSKGENVNAVKGFFGRLNSICNYVQPDMVVIAQDLGRNDTFRRKMYPLYKANRKPSQGNVGQQLRYGIQLLGHCGFPIMASPIYEADDILGMVGQFGAERGWDVILASSDRDYYQLINDRVTIFSPKHKRIIDREWILDRYLLNPAQLLDVKALAGDASDNIPGARGIGEKLALDLVRKYDSVENIYANLDQLPSRLKAILIDNSKSVQLSYRLGKIVTDYQLVMMGEKDFQFSPNRNPNETMALLAHLELPSLIPMISYAMLPFTSGAA